MTGDLLTEVPERALAVYAHPDDPDISCGGTLASWAAQGSEVVVVICASGDKGSPDPGETPEKLVSKRAAEVQEAASLLGIRRVQSLARKDGEFDNDGDLRREIVAAVRGVRPAVVVCPDPTAVFFGSHHYNHRDHRIVGWAVLDSVAPAAASPLYFPGTGEAHQVPLVLMSGSLEPDCWVDITETMGAKLAAVACHQSQLTDANDWFASALRDGAEEAGRQVGVNYAEAFRRLTLA